MTKFGRLYICDRCGDTGFAEYVGAIDRSGGGLILLVNLKNSKAGGSWGGKTCAQIVPKSIIRGSKVFGRRKSNDCT